MTMVSTTMMMAMMLWMMMSAIILVMTVMTVTRSSSAVVDAVVGSSSVHNVLVVFHLVGVVGVYSIVVVASIVVAIVGVALIVTTFITLVCDVFVLAIVATTTWQLLVRESSSTEPAPESARLSWRASGRGRAPKSSMYRATRMCLHDKSKWGSRYKCLDLSDYF